MNKSFLLTITTLFAIAATGFAETHTRIVNDGLQIGEKSTDGVGFHGATPAPQRSGVAEAALTLTPASGTISISAAPAAQAYASGTLTMGVIPTAGDSVTLGSSTYTFEDTFSGTSNQVLIGTNPTITLLNLIGAIKVSNTFPQANGTTYYVSGSTANASATAALGSNSTLVAKALSSGTAGNAIASTSSFTSGSNAWGGSTLSGGAAGDSVILGSGTYTFAASVSGTTPNLVLVSGTAGTASNLIAAINRTSSLAGTGYSSPTLSNTNAFASSGTASNQVVATAILGGTNGNNIALAKSGSNLSVSGTSLGGGAQFTDTNAAANLLNEIRAALVEKGLIKGQ